MNFRSLPSEQSNFTLPVADSKQIFSILALTNRTLLDETLGAATIKHDKLEQTLRSLTFLKTSFVLSFVGAIGCFSRKPLS